MPGFDYGNARIRAMKARLLTADDFEDLARLPTLSIFLSYLHETPYRNSLQAGLTQGGALESVHRILQRDLELDVGKTVGFFEGKPRRIVEVLVRRYEVDNARALFRGLQQGLPSVAITPALIATPVFDRAVWLDLAGSSTLREALDRMATLQFPWAAALLSRVAEEGELKAPALEEALIHWHYQLARQQLEALGSKAHRALQAVRMEIDHINIETAFRSIHQRQRSSIEALDTTSPVGYLPGGELPLSRLKMVAEAPDGGAAVQEIGGVPWARRLRRLWKRWQNLPAWERIDLVLRLTRLEIKRSWLITEPLGISVFLGYTALKVNEVSNLNWIASGIEAGLAPEAIQERVVWRA